MDCSHSLVALGFAITAGCLPTPKAAVTFQNSPLMLAQYPPVATGRTPAKLRNDAETASVTLPPGTANCSQGSFVLGTGKNDRYARSSSLTCLGSTSCFSPVDRTAVVPTSTIALPTSDGSGNSCAGLPTAPSPAYSDSYTDHVTVRTTAAGELVRVVLGVGKSAPTAPPCSKPVNRNVFFVDTSGDCGATWTSRAVIDNDASYDRQELYRDPWDGRLYITAIGKSGQELLASGNGGVSWSSSPKLINSDGDRPIVMTSFPAGGATHPRLVFFTCIGAKPSVIWSDDLGASFSSPVSLLDVNNTLPQCAILPSTAFKPDMWNVLAVSVGRSAWSSATDYAHVVYPTVTSTASGDRQDAVVANVSITRFGADKKVVAVMIQQIIGDNGASIYRPHLIDADRWAYQPDENAADANVALIDWYEVTIPSSGSGKMRYRGEVLRGASTLTKPFDLSRVGGAAKSWTPAPLASVGDFYGHYDYGSFYMDQGMFNFLVHWTESNAAVSGANMYIYGNIVQVQP